MILLIHYNILLCLLINKIKLRFFGNGMTTYIILYLHVANESIRANYIFLYYTQIGCLNILAQILYLSNVILNNDLLFKKEISFSRNFLMPCYIVVPLKLCYHFIPHLLTLSQYNYYKYLCVFV